MREKILELIEKEDPKNPLIDGEIADVLSINRCDVVKLRQELGILDYNERRLPYLKEAIQNILNEHPDISTNKLTKVIQQEGFNVSRFLVRKIIQETYQPQEEPSNDNDEDNIVKQGNDIFNQVIGANGSIEFQIGQARAAVLYPPNGLHTLILGSTGTGKSYLAETMFNLAVNYGRISKDAQLTTLNCADYSSNTHLLLSQLFGYVKGAFTGADYDKTGLIEKANGSILFLDEIHRLPLEGQEMLFSVIDKGTYRKLGQTEGEEKVNVMIVGATTEDINSHLLSTFRRRIPMLIELPPLAHRPVDERYKMVVHFLKREVDRIGVKIQIRSEALCALLLYDCPGNIGQLRSDIQVACARAYLKYLNGRYEHVKLDISDFNGYVQKGILRKKYKNDGIKKYLDQGIMIVPEQKDVKLINENDLYIMPDKIYRFMEERYETLRNQGLPQDLIYNLVNKELEIKLQRTLKYISKESKDNYEKKNIIKIVGKPLVDTVEKMVDLAETRLGPLDKSLIYCLSLHLHETIQRIKQNKIIHHPNLKNIILEYNNEFQTAKEMLDLAQDKLNIRFPEDEIGYVTLYLRTKNNLLEDKDKKVRIMVITHGNVALEMANIANTLIGSNFVDYICMPLDENPKVTLEKATKLAKKIDEGKGIIFLVDMGSLLTFGEMVTKITGIPTKTVGRVDTVMVLEAAMKAHCGETSLNELYGILERKNFYMGYLPRKNKSKKVIVTLCITGSGAALKLKKLIEDMIPELDKTVQIIPIGILQNNDVRAYIEKLSLTYDLLAVVGTVNPNIEGIQYLATETIIDGSGIKTLKKILKIEPEVRIQYNGEIQKGKIEKLLDEKLILPQEFFKTKEEVIEALAERLLSGGYVREDFLLNVYKRELQNPTIFANGIAIPHTFPKYVIKPAIAIATLEQPVKWAEDFYADKIFMLALYHNSLPALKYLYSIGNNLGFLHELSKCKNEDEIIDKLLSIFKT